jgi:sulfur relay (sulfurtransferase) complex TusBCD TusD component (DsrE family)
MCLDLYQSSSGSLLLVFSIKEERHMRIMRIVLVTAAIALSQVSIVPAFAADNDPLFVNATTDQPHRATMALVFSKHQQERKHPVAVFLNDRGVLIASKANGAKFKEQQELLKGLIAAGAAVLACPMCMEHYGVKKADLLPGIEVANPDTVGAALFKDGTKTLSW